MALEFEPLSPNKIEELKFIPDGTCVLMDLKSVAEKSGNYGTFFALEFTVKWGGRQYFVKDLLSANDYDRLLSYCLAAGIEEKYYDGKIFEGDIAAIKKIYAIVYRRKNKDPNYPDSNAVRKYVSPAEAESLTAKEKTTSPLPTPKATSTQPTGARIDDDIPF